MCYFITATLPAEADVERVREIAKRFRLAWKPVNNPYIDDQLRRGERQFCTTRGHCDCDTALGVMTWEEKPDRPGYSRHIRKLRGKGWSDTKIRRWLEQKGHDQEKRRRAAEAEAEQRTAEISNWLSFIRTTLEEGAPPSLGLLRHFFNGSLEDEEFRLKRGRSVPVGDLQADHLLAMEEDVLYEFRS